MSWRGTAQSLMSEQEKQMMPAILTLEGGLANANSMSTEKLVQWHLLHIRERDERDRIKLRK